MYRPFTTLFAYPPCSANQWVALAVRLVVIGAVLTASFVGLLVIASAIPNDRIVEHLQDSRSYFAPHRAPSPLPGRALGTRGECTWLSLGVGPSEASGVWSRAIRASAIDAPEQCQWLSDWLGGGAFRGREYYRYWHGYQIVTRPLLWLASYPTLRLLNAVAVIGLFVSLIAVVWRRIGARAALCLLAAAALMRFDNPVFTLNHGAAWILAIGAALLALRWTGATRWRAEFFFVVGALTTYFDLLTNPLATLSLPLLMILLIRKRAGEYAPWDQVRDIVWCSAVWALGYFGLWTVKFALDVLVIGPDAWTNIVDQAALHTVGNTPWGRPTVVLASVHNLAWYLRPAWRYWTLVAVTVVLILRALDARWRQAPQWLGLVIIAILPFLWFAVFAHHATLWAPVTSRYLFFTVTILFFGATAPLSPKVLRLLRRLRGEWTRLARKSLPERATGS